MQINDFLMCLKGVKQISADEYVALCPCHNDHKPSLHITFNDKGIACYCPVCDARGEQITSALGLSVSDLFFNSLSKTERIYDYTDTAGKYLYSKMRYRGKGFSYAIRQSDGTYSKGKAGLKGVYIPLGIEALSKAGLIAICEGEKDADTLASQGMNVFTTGGANTWASEFKCLCDNKEVLIFRDNDQAGKHLAEQIQADLSSAKSVTIINPTPNRSGGDISDFISEGGDLYALIAKSRTKGTERPLDVCDLLGDDKFNSLSKKQQALLLRILFLMPSMDIDKPKRKNCIYLNQALLSEVIPLYSRTDIAGLQHDIQVLIEKKYIKRVETKRYKRSIYKVLKPI